MTKKNRTLFQVLLVTVITQSFAILAAAPGAPTIGVATAGDAQATETFTAPASNGGSAITSYTATCGIMTATGVGSPLTVIALTNCVAVTCKVKATNVDGTGSESAASNSVTPEDDDDSIVPLIAALIPVCQTPTITPRIYGQPLYPGQPISLSVSCTLTPASYEWRANGVLIANATTAE